VQTPKPSLKADVLARIFKKFQIRYPRQWSAYLDGIEIDAVLAEWGRVLGDLSGVEIVRGFEQWTGNYPPNVFEFLEACRYPETVPYHLTHKPDHFEYGDPAIAEFHMKQIREILN
jgi:hypothetical protein